MRDGKENYKFDLGVQGLKETCGAVLVGEYNKIIWFH